MRYYPTSGGGYDVAIYHTPGTQLLERQNDQPLWAFKLDGTSGWPSVLPNPIRLPYGTWNPTMVTQDRLLLPIFGGGLFSVDLDSGQIDISPFELDYLGGRSPLAVNFNDGSDSIFFGYSSRLGLLAIVPSAVHNMSITSCSLTTVFKGDNRLRSQAR